MLERMRNDLATITKISITTDVWSSNSNSHHLMALTAHFIQANFTPGYLVLGAVPVKAKHKTGQVLADYFNTCLELMQIEKSKIHIVLRDAGSNMIAATGLLDVNSFSCFLHKINLAIQVKLTQY
jgi:hypothetical protein